MTIADFLKTLPQYLIPQHLLSHLMYALTRARLRVWKNWQIRWFIRRYGVDMRSAAQPDARAYKNFNDFFTRALRPDARSVVGGTGELACPVDGVVSQAGGIEEGRIIQAKGRDYSVAQLLGGVRRAAPFHGGHFVTLYLAPKDYHRIHMPVPGRLREMIYVPGRLFSVNTRTADVVPGLFARNERVVCLFDTEAGPMALILVGALFVGGMETVWHGTVTPPYGRSSHVWDYSAPGMPEVTLPRGAEVGRFNMGSTVIVLFGPRSVQWADPIQPGARVEMGRLLGNVLSDAATNRLEKQPVSQSYAP